MTMDRRVPPKLLFGEGFYQDAEVVVIQKASLPRLTASLQNAAESLLAALMLQSASVFSGVLQDQNGEVLTTENNEPLEFDNSAFYEVLNCSLWRVFPHKRYGVPVITHTFLIEVYASPSISYEQPITPDDL